MDALKMYFSTMLYILANVIAVDMHNAFMLASCVTFTTKLQILVVMIFLKFLQELEAP